MIHQQNGFNQETTPAILRGTSELTSSWMAPLINLLSLTHKYNMYTVFVYIYIYMYTYDFDTGLNVVHPLTPPICDVWDSRRFSTTHQSHEIRWVEGATTCSPRLSGACNPLTRLLVQQCSKCFKLHKFPFKLVPGKKTLKSKRASKYIQVGKWKALSCDSKYEQLHISSMTMGTHCA